MANNKLGEPKMNGYNITEVQETATGIYVVSGIILSGWVTRDGDSYKYVNITIVSTEIALETGPDGVRCEYDNAPAYHRGFEHGAVLAVWAYRLALSRLSPTDEVG
jgi:hypothetical protein